MLTTLPGQVLRFVASISVIAILTAYPTARAQQKPATPSPNSQAQLEARVKDLEARLNTAEQKAASAAMEKDYITRVQKQYETYYEKAFNTQIVTLTFLGLIIGLVGKFGLDRLVQHKLSKASAELRTEFNQQLSAGLDSLRTSNAAQVKELEAAITKRITQQERDLTTRSEYQFQFAQGLASNAASEYADARRNFRVALMRYKSGKQRQVIEERAGEIVVRNIFAVLKKEDQANYEANARKELADELYNGLEGELALAAVHVTWLGPLLKERKVSSETVPHSTPSTDTT